MHPFLILILLVAAAVIWCRTAPASPSVQARNKLLLYGGLGLLVVLLITGRLHPLIAAGAALVPVVVRLLILAQTALNLSVSGQQVREDRRQARPRTSKRGFCGCLWTMIAANWTGSYSRDR